MSEAQTIEKVTASHLIDGLYSLFCRNDYRLNNSYIFHDDWESDFFSVTKSNYAIEVEVKISRADFFNDFKKYKHRILDAAHKKKVHVVSNKGEGAGDFICNYENGTLVDRNRSYRTQRFEGLSRWDIEHRNVNVYAPKTRIEIIDLSKYIMPNQFYFCVPEGLIKESEVPDYAGLITMAPGSHYANMQYRAPYLHKTKLDLDRVLLKKFYNLWNYHGLFMKHENKSLKRKIENLENTMDQKDIDG
jgi:hypothetical protein